MSNLRCRDFRLGARLLLAAWGLAGCVPGASQEAGLPGSVEMALDVGGAEVAAIDWVINDSDGAFVDGGTSDVSQPGSTASLTKFGLLPGDYTIVLEASSTDAELSCTGSAPFSIEAERLTEATVVLNCEKMRRRGGVRVNGRLNHCAELTMLVVSPLQVAVGSTIDMMATATDEEGDAVTFRWSATSGSFVDVEAAATTYLCEVAGTHEITIAASDDAPVPFVFCSDSATLKVRCVNGELCRNDRDCARGQVCELGGPNCDTPVCVNGCHNNGQCGVRQKCVEVACVTCRCPGVCQPLLQPECRNDRDCARGQVCELGGPNCDTPVCVNGCHNNGQCGVRQKCVEVACVTCPCPGVCQ